MKIIEKTKIMFGYRVTEIESEDGITMFLEDMSGGPIIYDKDRKTAREKFKEALGLMESVMKLMKFKNTGTFTGWDNFKNRNN